MHKLSTIAGATLLGAAVAIAGCQSGGGKKTETTSASHLPKKIDDNKRRSLYSRLGGHDAIAAVVDDFVNNSAGDPAINFTRSGEGEKTWNASKENVARLKKLLTEQICSATGGPEKYTGRDMKTAHKGMHITDAQFGALAGQLTKSLQKFKVPVEEQGELVAIVASMKGDIVGQ